MTYVDEMAVIGVFVRRFQSVVTVLVTAGGLISGLASAAPATPASTGTGPGCPATMRTWTSQVTAVPANDPAAIAPANLSAPARTAFGRKVARLLAGHHGPLHWVSPTGCRRRPTSTRPASPAPPSRVAGNPVVTPAVNLPAISDNWSGFESFDGNYTGASMEWTIPNPAPNPSAPAKADASIWPGVGSGASTSDELVQAGTATDLQSDGTYTVMAWTEVYPDEPAIALSGFPARAGDDFAVNVAWDPSTHNAAFFLVNYTTGQMTTVTQHVNGTSGATAEWIIERGELCESTCITTPAADFGAEHILNGTADQTVSNITTSEYIGDSANYGPIDLVSCSDEVDQTNEPWLAETSTNVDSQGSFTDTWQTWGHAEPVRCTWKISPANSAFTATHALGTTIQLADTIGNLKLTCQSAVMSGTTGQGSQHTGSAKIASITGGHITQCTDSTGSTSWSIQQTSGSTWSLNADVGDTQGRTQSDITNIDADVTGGTCSFHIAGNVPPGKAVYQNPQTLSIIGANLTTSHVTGAGCATAKVADNDPVQLTGTYTFPGITVDP